ncbi:MAG TPA: pyridoxamine 5'-phosphate oxidase family protein [Verrucomicrobiae bacterium]|nr:pyridoxamine 5'-phosphate oxidase family protein [Verrucomicrobiae bacterium]
MEDKAKLKKIFQYVKEQNLAVMATVSPDAKPEAAVVGFSETDNFELYIGTYEFSRKFQNIKKNSLVALVIGWDDGKTVQYEGEIEEVTNPDEIDEFKRTHLAKMPSAVKYLENENEKFLKVKPHWVRYTDLSIDPWEVLEIRF